MFSETLSIIKKKIILSFPNNNIDINIKSKYLNFEILIEY